MNQSWVADDGSYGTGDVLVFNHDDITEEQWEKVDMLYDGDRIEYIQAILDEDFEIVEQIERNNGIG